MPYWYFSWCKRVADDRLRVQIAQICVIVIARRVGNVDLILGSDLREKHRRHIGSLFFDILAEQRDIDVVVVRCDLLIAEVGVRKPLRTDHLIGDLHLYIVQLGILRLRKPAQQNVVIILLADLARGVTNVQRRRRQQ